MNITEKLKMNNDNVEEKAKKNRDPIIELPPTKQLATEVIMSEPQTEE